MRLFNFKIENPFNPVNQKVIKMGNSLNVLRVNNKEN